MVDRNFDLAARYRNGERDFTGINFRGLEASLANFDDANFSGCDFSDAVLAGTSMSRCRFVNTEFRRVNALNARFIESDFRDARIEESAFGKADFFRADLANATLAAANFRGAFFVEAKFTDTKVMAAELSGCYFGENSFRRTLLAASPLRDCRFVAPCDVDVDTVGQTMSLILHAILHENKTPSTDSDLGRRLHAGALSYQQFFLAAGVPKETVLAYSGPLTDLAIKYESIFISYSSSDEHFADMLHAALEHIGIDTWFAPKEMKGGRKIHEQLTDAIEQKSRLILILSESSMASNWVATEIRRAMDLERISGKKKLFPIRITDSNRIKSWQLFDSDMGEDMAMRVREYYIPDFTAWQDAEAFARAVSKLAVDLQKENA